MRVITGDIHKKIKKKGLLLTIKCDCGEIIRQYACQNKVKCPKCKAQGELATMKAQDEMAITGTRIYQQFKEVG